MIILAPGQTAGTAGVTTAASSVITDSTNGLEALCEELQCVAVADAAYDTVANAVTWAGNNTKPNVMGAFNRAEVTTGVYKPISPYIAGAAEEVATLHGLQRGIQYARIKGIVGLEKQLSHSSRAGVTTDVSQLVGAYLSTGVIRRGVPQIVGDTFNHVADRRKEWAVARVAHHLEHVTEEEGENYISHSDSVSSLANIANAMQRAANQLVPNEIQSVTVSPSPDNNATTRAARQALFVASMTPHGSINSIRIDLTINT